jgi:hypothetical protein
LWLLLSGRDGFDDPHGIEAASPLSERDPPLLAVDHPDVEHAAGAPELDELSGLLRPGNALRLRRGIPVAELGDPVLPRLAEGAANAATTATSAAARRTFVVFRCMTSSFRWDSVLRL